MRFVRRFATDCWFVLFAAKNKTLSMALLRGWMYRSMPLGASLESCLGSGCCRYVPDSAAATVSNRSAANSCVGRCRVIAAVPVLSARRGASSFVPRTNCVDLVALG